jgi:hypothetical protein
MLTLIHAHYTEGKLSVRSGADRSYWRPGGIITTAAPKRILFTMAQQPAVGQGPLIIEDT